MSYDIVRGDLGPAMPVTVTENGTALDCSGADSVQLRWYKPDGTTVLTGLTEVDASVGSFIREWSAGDTDLIGPHHGEIVVTTAGVVQTYPSDGFKLIWWVNPQVGD